jgi:hypothetical protein
MGRGGKPPREPKKPKGGVFTTLRQITNRAEDKIATDMRLDKPWDNK